MMAIQLIDPLSVTFLIEEGRLQQVTPLHVVLRKQTGFYSFFIAEVSVNY